MEDHRLFLHTEHELAQVGCFQQTHSVLQRKAPAARFSISLSNISVCKQGTFTPDIRVLPSSILSTYRVVSQAPCVITFLTLVIHHTANVWCAVPQHFSVRFKKRISTVNFCDKKTTSHWRTWLMLGDEQHVNCETWGGGGSCHYHLDRAERPHPILHSQYKWMHFPVQHCDIQSYTDKQPESQQWRCCPTA